MKAPEQPRRLAHAARVEQPADTGRRHDGAVVGHGVDHRDFEAVLPAELPQPSDVANATPTESEVGAHDDLSYRVGSDQDVAHEGLRREGREGFIERAHVDEVGPRAPEELTPSRDRGQLRQGRLRPKERHGVGLEEHHHGLSAAVFGRLARHANERAMTQVNAVEVARGEDRSHAALAEGGNATQREPTRPSLDIAHDALGQKHERHARVS